MNVWLSISDIVLSKVTIGSLQHVIPILIAIVFTVAFIKYANQKLNLAQKQKAVHYLAWFISITLVSFHVYYISFGDYNFKTDLPLYLCSLMALLLPIFTYYRKYWMLEILIFWILGGTIQAIFTPDIVEGFPSFNYIRYWVVHLGLLAVIFYFIFVFKMKPTLKSVFKSILALQVYVLIMMGLNYLLGANYFYLSRKPQSASLLDYFGEWPHYILVGQLVLIPLFLLIYLPFYLLERKNRSLSK
ncbi:putative integral membrane protein (TIGR02206 family) [Winogradskyella epiphytica]|uniref:Putative integral membrane protein (TIGR02206 family) n=1 Tax=Winogradskyella epiphytica TaxID=262005 RepID=A0A2V4XXM1_9FLAO|nr:TIGR02206 family membrane protein [Winogradskyella epiphytica]PYE80428.1 putative integral membrane protein (TIGR02206 family) [Winogradskyella epiphytica]GGW69539.1 hypothetical protein GCM10008085_21880 [Winogradskyella epiphytica]